MAKKQGTQQNQIDFIHRWVRKTRSPFENDTYRICWYFNHETKDYLYEHKNDMLKCNGFSVSKGLAEKLPIELQERYFEPDGRGLLFVVFGSEIMDYVVNGEAVSDEDFLGLVGLSKKGYFAQSSFDVWDSLI
jgi:hypothetical protein